MTRKEVLEKAAQCVLQDRQNQYGGVENCFDAIGRLWSAYIAASGVRVEGRVTSFDVAMMMALLKIARAAVNPTHEDNIVDLAGYAACAGECMHEKEKSDD